MDVREWLGEDNEIGLNAWERKYRHNNESFEEWLDRVSGGKDDLRQLIKERKFLFGGRALANRGTSKKGSMFNCYSAGYCPDDINGIMELNTNLALTYKAQGGQGVSLTKVRPKGTPVGNDYESDGIVPFMKIFNATTAGISQGGARKGALMISLDIMHKEAETFITIKSNENEITKANLSLEIDDEFMKAVREYYYTGKIVKIHQIRNYGGHIVEYDVTPIELYKLMVKTVHEWGEPGCLFVNRFRNYNLMELDDDYNIETSNPCGEQPLAKDSCCNLGSLNLSEFVKNPYTEHSYFDYDEFEKAVRIGVEALDDIIDENLKNHALQEQADNSKNFRNIGLGVMGYANALFKLGLKYGSYDAIHFTNELFSLMSLAAIMKSCDLAKEKGAFPKCKPELIVESEIFKFIVSTYGDGSWFKDRVLKYGLRNCSLLSIAPTGSIATMLGISGGCEPEFALSYTRKTENLDEERYNIFCKSVKEYWEYNNTPKEERNIENLPSYFVTSADIPWRNRVVTQETMQNYVDTAISSTINLSENISVDEVERIYLYAWKKGLKGVTLFRRGCKRSPILDDGNKKEKQSEDPCENEKTVSQFNSSIPVARENIGYRLEGSTYVKRIACGKLYITINRDPEGNLVEVFIDSGKSGGCSANAECLGRFASAAMRNGMAIESIIDTTKGVKCSACTNMKGKSKQIDGLSCGDVLARTIKEEYEILKQLKKENNVFAKSDIENSNKNSGPCLDNCSKCPECGSEIQFTGGCMVCGDCGWSKCD